MKGVLPTAGLCLVALAALAADEAPALEALPLVEVPAESAGPDSLAFIITGDGGWARLVRTVAAGLAAQGIPVVGLNSLRYFRTERSAEECAAALELILRHYLAAWHRERIVLIGYSRGADLLPFMASRLPPDLRGRVDVIALLGPGTTTSFRIHLLDWVLHRSSGTVGTRSEIEKLGDFNILCVYGSDEKDSACPGLPAGLARLEERRGGHHFDGDYAAIAGSIIAAAGK
jgi:type IV secretory pathway VirJ component